MGTFTKIAIGALASTFLVSTAMAADLMAPPPPEAAMMSSADWTGLYLGADATYDLDGYVSLQGVVGAQFQTGSLVFGGELAYGPYWGVGSNAGTNGQEGYLAGKFGFAADSALLYGLVGVSDVDGTIGRVAGAGVEFKLADNISLRGQVVQYFDSSWAADFAQVSGGVLFHF